MKGVARETTGPAAHPLARPGSFLRSADVDASLELIRGLDKPQLVALVALLLADVADELEEPAADAPPAIDRTELKRRCSILAHRAEGHYARRLCPVCGEEKAHHALASHIRRRHAEQVAAMPAAEFRRPGPRVAG